LPTKQNQEKPAPQGSLVVTKLSIQSLSDIVFGLALSIGTLTLINNIATSDRSVISAIITFGFSFFVLILIWFRYNRILEIIKAETQFEINLNIIMLFLVVIEPYLFNLLHATTTAMLPFTSTLFALDIAGMMFVLGSLYSIAIKDYKAGDNRVIRYYNYRRNGLLLTGVVFLASLLPIFWNTSLFGYKLRFVIWALALLGLAVRGRREIKFK
jgi:uncharacterized membrane protein